VIGVARSASELAFSASARFASLVHCVRVKIEAFPETTRRLEPGDQTMDLARDRRTFLQTAGLTAALILAAYARIPSVNSKPTSAMNMNMTITRNGSQPSGKGPADWFTGTVRIDPLFQPKDSARAAAASVTFEPGARTAWHTHPLGQTLIVTAGCGRVQVDGGPIEEIRPGDVVWFPPGVKHWHGAAPTTAMTHIAIQEQLDGKVVDWLEHVTDEQYQA
jgi:quercetin dioxygenase-like cupin family protein